jgi:hypothetical protein
MCLYYIIRAGFYKTNLSQIQIFVNTFLLVPQKRLDFRAEVVSKILFMNLMKGGF